MAPLTSKDPYYQAIKCPVASAVSMDYMKWTRDCKQHEKWVIFDRNTRFFCQGCFLEVGDPSKHMTKGRSCGYTCAVNYMGILCKNNSSTPKIIDNKRHDRFNFEPKMLHMMLHGDTCPVGCYDILCQTETWDPRTVFEAEPDQSRIPNKHTCSSLTCAKSFKEHYDTWRNKSENKKKVEKALGYIEYDTKAANAADCITDYYGKTAFGFCKKAVENSDHFLTSAEVEQYYYPKDKSVHFDDLDDHIYGAIEKLIEDGEATV